MRIETTIKRSDWEQLGKVLYASGSRIFAHAIALICFYFAYRYYRQGQGSLFAYYLLVPFVIEGISIFLRNRRLKTHLRFFDDTYQGKDVDLVYTFNKTNFQIDNSFSKDRMTYDYEILAEFIDTPDDLVIAAYGRQWFIINRKAAEENKLKEFLLEKNPEIKTAKKGLFRR